MPTPLTSGDIERISRGRREGRGKRIKLFSDVFPYLLVPVLLYNLIALFSGPIGRDGQPGIARVLDTSAFSIPMLSEVSMRVHWGELVILFAVIFLFVEIIKSTNTASSGIVNHILSMVLFIFCLMQFLVFASFATGTYFIITMIVLIDALAGMVVTIISARRDFGVEGIGG